MEDSYGAKLDQGKASMHDVGILHACYWKALVSEGMSRDEATKITAAYVSAVSQPSG